MPKVRFPKKANGLSEIGPFRRADKEHEKRLKVFLWGDTGTLKTRTALSFPSPVVIDLERGSGAYEGEFDFHVVHASNPEDVRRHVHWLNTNHHPFRTLVIDSITEYWEALQKYWSNIFLQTNVGGVGHHKDFYTLQVGDWSQIKADFRELIRLILELDMNVVITAHEKAMYDEQRGFMKRIGETFAGEKRLPYLFDIVYQCTREGDEFKAIRQKARYLVPETIEPPYREAFEKAVGEESLEREAKPFMSATEAQVLELKARTKDMDRGALENRLAAYGAEKFEDLSHKNADLILKKIATAQPKAKAEAS